MYLILDLGNTNQKMAILPGGELRPEVFSVMTERVESYPEISLEIVKEFAGKHPSIKACILSSVVPVPREVSSWLKHQFPYTEFDQHTAVPLKNLYETPETLGKDRLAAAVGGATVYPGKDVLVVNAGTALTYELVTSAGEYPGGSISPGLTMRFRALHTFTKQLPLLTYSEIDSLAGNNTDRSVLSGVINGMAAEIEGMIARYREEYPEMEVILSGGDMNYFVNRLKISIFALPNIVIYGLQQILAFNDKKHI